LSTHSSTVRQHCRRALPLTLQEPISAPPFSSAQNRATVQNSLQELRRLTYTLSFNLGLSRLEYRGYDSAGFAIDGDKKKEVFAFKEVGKVAKLKQLTDESDLDLTKVFDSHCGIAHTRWATHGPPSRINCHPHRYVSRVEPSLWGTFRPESR
jgi:glutamate synthase domain-containing protein 1